MTIAGRSDQDTHAGAVRDRVAETEVGHSTSSPSAGLPVLALFLIAAFLRLALWMQQRSLWIDEARLSLNVASRSYLDLLPPLDYDQSAPLVYLWIQRSIVDLCGVNESSFRLLALAAGIGTVPCRFSVMCFITRSTARGAESRASHAGFPSGTE